MAIAVAVAVVVVVSVPVRRTAKVQNCRIEQVW
jgi:hypothetical protein